MINLFFAYIIIFILFFVGAIILKMLRPSREFIENNGLLIAPILGLIGIVNITEIFNLIMPIKYITVILISIMTIGVVLLHRWILFVLKLIFKNRMFWFLLIAISFVYAVPFINRTELVSIQYFNNDIIYYLGSMEWLRDNRSIDPVLYDNQHMIFWCAEYMLTHTRIGFDSFGAFIMSLFLLDSHQVFTSIGIVAILLMQFLLFYIESDILKIEGKAKYFILCVVMLCANWSELLELQYIPQIFGIVLFLSCIMFTLKIFSYRKNKSDIFIRQWLLCLSISGTLAIYAEFASYIFISYLIFAIGAMLTTKHVKGVIITSSKVALLSIALNPIGFYRCLKINLFVLINSGADKTNIDPYAGNIMPFYNVISKLLGLPLATNFSGAGYWVFTIFVTVIVLIALTLIYFYLINTKNLYKYMLIGILTFFLIYEMYFRISKYAYGEYKHLLAVSAISLFFLCFMIYKVVHTKKYLKILVFFMGIFLIGETLYRMIDQYYMANIYYYDSKLMEISEIDKYVPKEEPIGLSGSAGTIHGEVYALKKQNAVILSNNISYFPFSDIPFTKYRIYEADIDAMDNAKILWKNGRFTLVENVGLQSAFYSGFHPFDNESNSIWTCDNESIIYVTNFSEDRKTISLSFGTETSNNNSKKIKVMLDGTIIADDTTGNQIVTETFNIEPGEIKQIYIYSSGPLDRKNELTVGIKLTNYAIVQYEME